MKQCEAQDFSRFGINSCDKPATRVLIYWDGEAEFDVCEEHFEMSEEWD